MMKYENKKMAAIIFPAFSATSCVTVDMCPPKLDIKTHEICKIKRA